MGLRGAFLLCAVAAAAAAVLPSRGMMRFRGGEDDSVRKEVLAKLNQFPTFCILNGEGQVIGLPNDEGGHDVCWYIDAAEAKELLELTVAGNPCAPEHAPPPPLPPPLRE